MRCKINKIPPVSDEADPNKLQGEIREHAMSLGFDQLGFGHPSDLGKAGSKLREFVELGRHGEMQWMVSKVERRAEPKKLWPKVSGIIVVAINYGPEVDPLVNLNNKRAGTISVYARGQDYHKVVKPRLKRLGRWIASSYGADVKVFVDTAPVMEKPLAAAAGLGWQGKHTNLVSQKFGSWLFLGVLYTTLQFASQKNVQTNCGSCRRCLDICPTDAFPAPYELDARRCISYLTIEHKGQIGREFRSAIGNRIYGCDDCLAVCPWNKFARRAREVKLCARPDLLAPELSVLVALNDKEFRSTFAGSPIKRLGRDRFVRNVLIAIGNSGDRALAESTAALFLDSSPLVRGMAVWAWQRLVSSSEIATRRRWHLSQELDPLVAAEWQTDTVTNNTRFSS